MALPRLIGFAGYGRVGKDTAANHVASAHPEYERRAFADKVREVAALFGDGGACGDGACGQSYNQLVIMHGYEGAKTQYPGVRAHLVKVGQKLREILGDDLWINQVINESDESDKRIVISDVRYHNEAYGVLHNGMLIWIERPGVGPANETEARETAPLRELADAVIVNDGTIADMTAQIDKILAPES